MDIPAVVPMDVTASVIPETQPDALPTEPVLATIVSAAGGAKRPRFLEIAADVAAAAAATADAAVAAIDSSDDDDAEESSEEDKEEPTVVAPPAKKRSVAEPVKVTKPVVAVAKPVVMEEKDYVNIKARGANTVIYFKVKRSSTILKIAQAYCAKTQTNIDVSRFIFEGRRLQMCETVEEIGLRDDDEIDVMITQMGGGGDGSRVALSCFKM